MVRPTHLLTLFASLAVAWPHHEPTGSPRIASREAKKKNPKYYHEVGGSQALMHYDRRFYTGEEVPYHRHRWVLRGLITSYLAFFEEKNAETWIAHGTLLGWWWNGRIMPWDLDLDVQVTAPVMQYMGDTWNQTEIAWNYTVPIEKGVNDKEELVETRYLLDINPHHNDTEVDRMNIIDGRWIDMGTGMYIDLTVLKERDPEKRPGIWACTNNHRYSSEDLWPMRVTEFEGVRALIPHNFERILADEYGNKGMTLEEFHGHKWNHELKQWVKDNNRERKDRTSDVARWKQEKEGSQKPLEGEKSEESKEAEEEEGKEVIDEEEEPASTEPANDSQPSAEAAS